MSTVLTDPTPVPAGSWLLIVLRPSIAGLLDFIQPVSVAAAAWQSYAPTTWRIDTPVVQTSSFWAGETATTEVQVPDDTTIGAVATLADNVSNQLSVVSVTLVGADPLPVEEWQTTTNNPDDPGCGTVSGFLSDPFGCTWSFVQGPILIVLVLVALYFLYTTGTLRKLQSVVKKGASRVRK